jgi:hypothetical protein
LTANKAVAITGSSYPQLQFTNTQGKPYGLFYAGTNNDEFCNLIIRVHSDENTYKTFSFVNNGSLQIEGDLYC